MSHSHRLTGTFSGHLQMCVYKCVELTDLNLSVNIHTVAECVAALKCVKCRGKEKVLAFYAKYFFISAYAKK